MEGLILNKKTSESKNKLKLDSSNNMSFSGIDVLIDKNELDNNHAKKIDKEQFSLKNKKGSRIYFLRKKSSKVNYKKDSDILSDEKISETQKNLREGQLEINDKNRDIEKKLEETNKRKSRIQLNYSQKNKETDDILFLIIAKNPYDWLNSLHRLPHHAPLHMNISFSEFIRKKWECYWNPTEWKKTYHPDIKVRMELVKPENLLEEAYKLGISLSNC